MGGGRDVFVKSAVILIVLSALAVNGYEVSNDHRRAGFASVKSDWFVAWEKFIWPRLKQSSRREFSYTDSQVKIQSALRGFQRWIVS